MKIPSGRGRYLDIRGPDMGDLIELTLVDINKTPWIYLASGLNFKNNICMKIIIMVKI